VQKLEEDFNLIASYCRHGKYREIEEAISQVRPHANTYWPTQLAHESVSEWLDLQTEGRSAWYTVSCVMTPCPVG
jgi:hypothetical protein